MTTFVHRALPLWTVPATGRPKPYAASVVFYPDDGIVEIAVPRGGGGVPHSAQFPRSLLLDGLAGPVEGAGVCIAPRPDTADWILFVLTIDGRTVEFHAERAAIDEFVDASLALPIHAGVDVDELIARILEEA